MSDSKWPAARGLDIPEPFDLARTTAPVWWARGRWPNVDWRDDALYWCGWEEDRLVWRSIRQRDPGMLTMTGTASEEHDREWATRVLGFATALPTFPDPILGALAHKHGGMRSWAAGSLYEGFVSAIVGQSISVAAAAVTERRLYELFNRGQEIAGRRYWPPPRPEQLAAADPELVRRSGVTRVRAEALAAIGNVFSERAGPGAMADVTATRELANQLLAIRGIGRWSVESALLWGLGHPDAHPSGDVALLRAARRHWPEIATLKDLDRQAEGWRPNRGWAARLLWLDLLGFARDEAGPAPTRP